MTERAPLEVEEFLTHLAIEKGRSANTLAAYRRDLGSWAAHTSTPISQRSADDVLAFNRSLQAKGLAPASVNRAMAAVRGLHRFLVAEDLMPTDPTADVEAGKLPRGLPKALTEDEVSRLLDAVTGEAPADRRDRAILEVLYGTGMRISEMVALSLEDLDLDGALMRVTGKGDKQRLVPVGRLAAAAVDDWLSPGGRSSMAPESWARRSDQNAVFLNQRGGRLSRQGIWGVVRKHGLTAGIADRLTPHVLRHSCATHMLDHGADIRTVQELLGHASVTTTQLYTKVSTDLMVRAYAAAHPRAAGRPGIAQ
jgi:integrase/recombinase XerD